MAFLTALIAKLPSISDPKGLFALFAVVALVLYGLSVGRTKALISLLSIYVAYVLTLLFPFEAWLAQYVPEGYQPLTTIGLFVVLYVIVFSIFSRALTRTRLSPGEISLLHVAIVSVVQVGLLVSIGASLAPQETVSQWLGPAQRWVSGTYALWAWAAASVVVMLFIHPHRHSDE